MGRTRNRTVKWFMKSVVDQVRSTTMFQVYFPEPLNSKGEPGPCKNFLYKWRFEVTTQECTTFIWGGCNGNIHNRFETENECLHQCIGGNCN